MAKRGMIAVALLAASALSATAQTARYGSPSACAGNAALGGPYLYYDGSRMIAGFTCDLVPANGKMKGACTGGPEGPFIEEFAVAQTPAEVTVKRADGSTLLMLPACG